MALVMPQVASAIAVDFLMLKLGLANALCVSSAMFPTEPVALATQRWSALFLEVFLRVHGHKHCFLVPGLWQVHLGGTL